MIKLRKLGNTDLSVSEIGLGCWQLGGLTTINDISITYGDVNEKTAQKIISRALELGVNTFDTADSYSLGNSERRLGMALSERRSEVHIFTKGAAVPSYNKQSPFDIDLSYHHLLAAIDRSLTRLGTEYVDLYQAHAAPKSESDFANLEKTFSQIKADGKSLYCGVSIGSEYQKGIELIKRGIVDSIQLYFSLLDFEPIMELLPLAKKNGVGIIVAEPLAQGFLTGKYNTESSFPKTDIRSRCSTDEIKTKVKRSQQFAFLTNESRTMNQIALAYVLTRDEVSICIPGAKSVEQLESNVKSSEISINIEEIGSIQKIQQNW